MQEKPRFFVTHLYPEDMCIYGDMGNIHALRFRLEKLGCQMVYQPVRVGDALPEYTDFYFIGGGQDNEQYIIFKDLITKKAKLIADVNDGACLLSICGGYQLLGKSFLTGDKREIEGIGLFPVQTKSSDASVKSRCIGNLIVECNIPELRGAVLVGFENHGGQTFALSLNDGGYLGRTLVGFGNNSSAEYEGFVYKHAVGTYLHGSCLPKNPELTQWFITKGFQRQSRVMGTLMPDLDLTKVDDTIALSAKNAVITRFLTKV